MAKIIGLKEKQLALTDINHKLKSLIPINEFLNEINPSGLYTISFTKNKPQVQDNNTDVDDKENVETSNNEAVDKNLVKRSKRSKEEKLEAPFLCSDADTVKSFVLAYKKQLVDEIRAKAEEFSIEFDDEDEALLK